MSAKHTPGPWKVIAERSANDAFVFEIAEVSSYRVIPDRADTFSEEGDAFADASLIAAAPDLLNAVRFLLSNPDSRISQADRDAAYAAIAKATGAAK